MSFLVIIVLILIFIFYIYPYIVYPLILLVLANFFNKKILKSSIYPEISIIISAYNEERYIQDCILSILTSDYPLDKIKIYVGSDGSTDKTCEIVTNLSYLYSNIFLYKYQRSGKNALINKMIRHVNTDYVLFLDADLRLQKDSLASLMSNFNDDSIGCVLANLIIQGSDSDNTGHKGEILYQKFETYLRDCESSIESTVNNLGTLYGIRRELFESLPNDLVCDDMYILLTVVSKHKRAIFDKKTSVIEVRKKSLKDEMKRRVRLVAGGLSTIQARKELLSLQYGIIPFFLFSHKIIRYTSPLILILIAIISILTFSSPILFFTLLIIQGLLYFSALLGYLFEKFGFEVGLFRFPLLFVSMNISILQGLIRFIQKGQNATWERIDTKIKSN